MRSFTAPAISCSRGVRLRARGVPYFCDPTTPLDQAGEGLAFARGIARDRRRGGSLVGSVLITERAGDAPSGLLSPLGGVTIAIRGGAHAFSTTTDSTGQYALRDVAPGLYLLTVSASLDVDPIPPATIQVKGPGACVVHTIVLSRPGPAVRSQPRAVPKLPQFTTNRISGDGGLVPISLIARTRR